MCFKKFIYVSVLVIFMGCETPIPKNAVAIKELSLWVDEHEVTALQFENFHLQYDMIIASDSIAGWWFSIDSNTWESSFKATHLYPNSAVRSDSLSPAVQVSWVDACAYCNAKNGRLPTEEEWLFFTKGSYNPGNIWEGYFPLKDEGLDGYKSVSAPVKSFKAHSNGLYDLFGNVWEWTSSKDSNGNYSVKSGSYLTDYNSGGFLPDFKIGFRPDSLRADLGFRCVYEIQNN